MTDIALAAQALSACDRLEQGVKERDPDTMESVREMITRWSGAEFAQASGGFAMAFKALMEKCLADGPEGLDIAMMAFRCYTEAELKASMSQEQ